MSKRPNIPDGDRYRVTSDLSTECAHLILDLISREFSTRTEGEGKFARTFMCSEVYEPVMDDLSTGESPPAIRVRRELADRLEQPVFAGQTNVQTVPSAVKTAEPSETPQREMQVYTLDIGEALDSLEIQPGPDFDVHDMYSWTPLITAIIEKNKLPETIDDLEDDEFEEVLSHIHYTDNGEQPDELELIRLIGLLHSILYTAREAAAYEPSIIPSTSSLEQLGRLTTRDFGAFDAYAMPCARCIEVNIPCAHTTDKN